MSKKAPAERVVRDIRRKTRRQYSAEEKIRIVLEGFRGEVSSTRAALNGCWSIGKSLVFANPESDPVFLDTELI